MNVGQLATNIDSLRQSYSISLREVNSYFNPYLTQLPFYHAIENQPLSIGVLTNREKWALCAWPEDYRWSSARFYKDGYDELGLRSYFE